MSATSPVSLALAALGLALARWAAAQQADADTVLFHRPIGGSIEDSRYGPVAAFQRAVLADAQTCGLAVDHPDRFADGRYGAKAAKLLTQVAACRHLALADPTGDTITEATWRAIAPGVDPPNARQRARAMSFKFEGTDYDQIEWNVDTPDDGILTWGPLGATAGQAAQVQRILLAIDAAYPDEIPAAFGPEAAEVRRFGGIQASAPATRFIRAVRYDMARKASWDNGFAVLGRDPRMRAVYDRLMDAGDTAGVPEAINDFTLAYWARCLAPTEVDYGFFFDRAIQLDVRQSRVDAAAGFVDQAQSASKRRFTPAERRRAYAANWTAGKEKWVANRLARDVGYYIDGIPADGLADVGLWGMRTNPEPRSPNLTGERALWAKHSAVRAADYGLRDERVLPAPTSLLPRVPECLRKTYGG